MQTGPDKRIPGQLTEEEYRRRVEIKAKRRKKRRMQRMALIGVFVLFGVLLVVCAFMIIKAIVSPAKTTDKKKKASESISVSSDVSQAAPVIKTPVAPDRTRWELLLVNQLNPLPSGYNPVLKDVSTAGHKFDERAAQPLMDMVAACNNANPKHTLSIISASRGEKTQNEKYNALVELFKSQGDDDKTADERARWIEPPYPMSDHQTSLSVDFVTKDVPAAELAFAETSEYKWLIENAAEYGFILRFPQEKQEITHIKYQPFHFRYVGKEDAKVITQAGICLEEYLIELPPVEPASAASGSSASASASGA